MTHRRGVTLVEVLAAIFIMGIGLLALLTLFPLGALSMARAVRDHNVAMAGTAADSLAEAFAVRTDANVNAAFNAYFSTPLTIPSGGTAALPNPDGPGYPVYVDPFYRSLNSTTLGRFQSTPGIRRSTVAYGGGALAAANAYFTYMDDLTLADNGTPSAAVDRPGRITWAYLLRRPRSATSALVELSVVVYNGRDTTAVTGETSFVATGNKGTTTLTLTYAGGAANKPAIRPDNWILDTTYETSVDPLSGTAYGTIHGYFYQVANVEDPGDGQTLTLELQTPLRANVSTVVFMENVVYVLERGTGWKQ